MLNNLKQEAVFVSCFFQKKCDTRLEMKFSEIVPLQKLNFFAPVTETKNQKKWDENGIFSVPNRPTWDFFLNKFNQKWTNLADRKCPETLDI